MSALLAAISVSKSYGGVRALKEVNFALQAGEIHALVGENGAGKSTLIRILAGAAQADAGTIEMHGHPVRLSDPLTAKAHGIAVIYQQPALFPDLTVAENIGLALETRGLWRRIDWRGRAERARELLAQLGAGIDPKRLAGSLSMPEQQMVEIAKSLGASARVFILDEPTACLSGREVDALFDVLRGLRERGAGIVYVSHRLEELPRVAQRVTVLRDGTSMAAREMSGVDRAELIHLMVGRDLPSVFPKRPVPIGDPVLEIQGLTRAAAGLRDVSLNVRAGEIAGLAGLVGAGRTELAETLFGLHPMDSGSIVLNGRKVRIGSPEHAVRQGIAYVPEDRRRHGLVMELSVAANATLAALSNLASLSPLNAAWERAVAADCVERLAVKTASIFTPVRTLSGGNQQKVCLGRWLQTKPSVLILDEPTQGVDVGAKAEIHRLMCDLAEQGLAILMISSDLPEILGMSDRIVVMRAGRVAGVLDRAEASQQALLSLALGSGGGAA